MIKKRLHDFSIASLERYYACFFISLVSESDIDFYDERSILA